MKVDKFINTKPYLIAGPCSAESSTQLLQVAESLIGISDVFRAGIWKPRTAPGTFEGVGKRGLKWLTNIKRETGLKVMTEVATAKHVELCLEADIDMLWIGARTTVNPFYVQEIADSLSGIDIPIFVKNPIHPELDLWIGALERFNKVGITQLAAVHRGFFSTDKITFRNNPKWEVPIKLKELVPQIPIICDPSHIAGNPITIQDIAQTAMDLDMDGLMIETHLNPISALSDSQQQIKPRELVRLMKNLILRKSNLDNKEALDKLNKLRKEIDFYDSKIVQLLNTRKELVKDIASLKKEYDITVFQIERWYTILKNRKQDATRLNLNEKMLAEIFELIHKYSILTQTKIMRS